MVQTEELWHFQPSRLRELQQNSPRPHQVVTAPSYLPFIFIFTILILLDLVVTAPIYLILLYTYVSYTRYLADFFIDNPSTLLDVGQTLVCKVMEKKDEDYQRNLTAKAVDNKDVR